MIWLWILGELAAWTSVLLWHDAFMTFIRNVCVSLVTRFFFYISESCLDARDFYLWICSPFLSDCRGYVDCAVLTYLFFDANIDTGSGVPLLVADMPNAHEGLTKRWLPIPQSRNYKVRGCSLRRNTTEPANMIQ